MANTRRRPSKKNQAERKREDAVVKRLRNVVPDSIDLRDRQYMPSVTIVPAEMLAPDIDIPVLNQRDTSACTGFALASVIYHLQRRAKRKAAESPVSPFMLYSMARRYDEFPGDPNADTGSSLRGGMKGWYKHGACNSKLWPEFEMPAEPKDPRLDWWLDAVKRPVGAYYRVNAKSVTDMHVALNEIGALYASAVTHDGWNLDGKVKVAKGQWRVIPKVKVKPTDGAHAFAIVGYTREGFIVHNSWDTDWGTNGQAVLTYDDWLENAMDCWVAQLGVVTDLHLEIAGTRTLGKPGETVQLAANRELRSHQLDPYIIDMENNGRLSNTGEFRTQAADVSTLVTRQLADARKLWGLKDSDAVDIAVYAHGGLTSEDGAADTAAKWVKTLYDNRIFPIFLMWETDLWSTLKNIGEDFIANQRTTGGMLAHLTGWWNQRLEKMLAVPGTAVWGEMKKNADAISAKNDAGGMVLYEECMKSALFADLSKVRLHLIGHSAGSIVHSSIIERLSAKGWTFETVNFLAPAVRMDTFAAQVIPAIRRGRVKRYNQFHMSDDVEQKDPTCGPILGYSRSLLYLVSQSFEKGVPTKILGMEKYFQSDVAPLGLRNVSVFTAPGQDSRSTTHGGFDDDAVTMGKVISLIKER
jgi:hypothetical protein